MRRVKSIKQAVILPALTLTVVGPLQAQQAEDSAKAEAEESSEPETEEPSERDAEESNVPEALDEGGRIDLACGGSGSANKSTVTQGYGSSTVTSQYGQAYGSSNATIYGTRSQQFGDQVSLFVEGDEGRIRMPRAMLPLVRGGDDGWFKLGDIQIKDNEITATVRVNFMNKPKLRIDRYTGAISISGKAGDYAGQCHRIVPEETQRRF